MRTKIGAAGLVAIFLTASLAAWAADPEPALKGVRVWKDDTGSFEIRAELLKVENGTAHLRRTDGVVLQVPVAKLSAADRLLLPKPPPDPNAPPPEVPLDEKLLKTVTQSLVLVTIDRDGEKSVVPSYVAGRDATRAYVLVPSYLAPRDGRYQPAPKKSLKFTITSGTEPETRTTPAELTGRVLNRVLWILAAPADSLPPPLTLGPALEPNRSNVPIRFVGYDKPSASDARELTRIVGKGTAGTGPTTESMSIYPVDSDRMAFCIVLTQQGTPIGICQKNLGDPPGMLQGNFRRYLNVSRKTFSELVGPPSALTPNLLGISREATKSNYEVKTLINDPLNQVVAVRALVRPKGPKDVAPPTVSKGPGQESILDAQELKMEQRAPVGISAESNRIEQETHLAKSWVAPLTVEEPKPADRHDFFVQFVIKTRDGGESYGTIGTATRFWKPTDYPEIEAHPRGGFQITSRKTRRDVLSVAEPQLSDREIFGEPAVEAGWQVRRLELDQKRDWSEQSPAIYSADGQWFYLVSRENVLHKVKTSTLQEERILALGGPCKGIALSSAGLVLLFDKGSLWIVDPQTLQVKRELPISVALRVAASPSSPVGVVFGTAERAGGPVAMWVVNYAEGRIVHQLLSRYSGGGQMSSPLAIEKNLLLDGQPRSAMMTADGKHLFVGTGSLHRLRLEGEDLVWEGATEKEFQQNWQADISPDGKLAVLLGLEYTNSRGGVMIIDARQFAEKRLRLPLESPCFAVGFGHAGDFYAATRGKVVIFNSKGTKTGELTIADPAAQALIFHPTSEEFLIAGRSTIAHYRKQP